LKLGSKWHHDECTLPVQWFEPLLSNIEIALCCGNQRRFCRHPPFEIGEFEKIHTGGAGGV
jgi:hypothetical protein